VDIAVEIAGSQEEDMLDRAVVEKKHSLWYTAEELVRNFGPDKVVVAMSFVGVDKIGTSQPLSVEGLGCSCFQKNVVDYKRGQHSLGL